MSKALLLFFLTSGFSYGGTALTAQNILGKYDMQGVVHLKANLLPKNKLLATQIGIIFDTACEGTYKFIPNTKILEAKLNCDGDSLNQKINFSDKTMEDLESGTTVNVFLEYKSDKYNLDFDIIKEESFNGESFEEDYS